MHLRLAASGEPSSPDSLRLDHQSKQEKSDLRRFASQAAGRFRPYSDSLGRERSQQLNSLLQGFIRGSKADAKMRVSVTEDVTRDDQQTA